MIEHPLPVGTVVRDTQHVAWVTIVEVLHKPDAVAAPRIQYRVDIGQGWLTTIWPQDVLEVIS